MKKKILAIMTISLLTSLCGVGSGAEPLTVVFPTGNEITDKTAVQAAVNLGGVVLLKATNQAGIPTAFNFGKLEYNFAYAPNNPASLNDINNHRVQINKGVLIHGETTGNGQMTTILNGWQSFAIGTVMYPDGDVTIKGIHFRDSGMAGIAVMRTRAECRVTIENNKFTGRMYDLFNFSESDKPYWNLNEAWNNGEAIRMMDREGEDVTGFYTVEERKEAWRNAFAYMYYNFTFGIWMAEGIFVGGTSVPGGVKGPAYIISNYLNMEEESNLPFEFEKVWHETFVIYCLGSKGEVLISQNIIKNGTARDINLLDLTDEVTVDGNAIEIGPLGSYHLSTVEPYLSKAAIVAVYRFFFGDSLGFPAIGGVVYIAQNTITSSFASKDAGGISVYGLSIVGSAKSTWNSAHIEANDITVLNGRHGISIGDTGAISNGANVIRNRIRGTGLYAMLIGNLSQNAPLMTADNTFVANNILQFRASALGTSSPTFTPADVLLYSDTRDNVLAGFSGTVIDLGSSNHITGQPKTIQGGVGPEVSESMHEIHDVAPDWGVEPKLLE